MLRYFKSRTYAWIAVAGLTLAAGAMFAVSGAQAQNKEPIKIGFSMALTGGLAPNGKQALLGAKIWEEDVNKNGGLLGRQVKIVYYDDQSNPSNVPSIYTKLLDVDKVDLVVGPYATAMIAPAMPVVIAKKKVFIGLFGLAVNSKFNYPNYFSMLPSGPDTKPAFTEGFFQVAAAQKPKPATVSLTWSDLEFSKNACEGARANAKKFGIKIVYDKSYPPSTTDFSPIVRALQAANADIVVVCSYPNDSVGMLNAIKELNYKPKMLGHRVQEQARPGAQRHHQLRDLGAVTGDRRDQQVPGGLPVARGGRRRRSARLLSRHLGLRLPRAAGDRDQGNQEHRG